MGLPDGCLSTKRLHASFAQHAADGALPAALACVDGDARSNDWYTPKGGNSGQAVKGNPRKHMQAKFDPLNDRSMFPADAPEKLWSTIVELTGAEWNLRCSRQKSGQTSEFRCVVAPAVHSNDWSHILQ